MLFLVRVHLQALLYAFLNADVKRSFFHDGYILLIILRSLHNGGGQTEELERDPDRPWYFHRDWARPRPTEYNFEVT